MKDDRYVPVEQEDLPDPDEQADFLEPGEQADFLEPDEQEEARVPVPPRPPRQRRGRRHTLLWATLGVLAALAVVSWMLNQSLGSGAIDTTGAGSHQATPAPSTPIPTLAPVTPIPTVSVRGTPVGPIGGPTGTLILLNPGIVRQGASLGVTGSGFDARATVDLAIKQQPSDSGQVLSFVQTDKYGTFYSNLTVPITLSAGTFYIQAAERGRHKLAQARGVVQGGTPQLKLGSQVGKPGDLITVSVSGFSPGEAVKVYWNTVSGQPVASLQADGGGSIGQAPVQVPFGAPGLNTFLLVGARSQSMVAASFYLLSLYPTIKLSSYALRAGNQLSFSGAGFGPGERVVVFLNSEMGQPLSLIQTTQHGNFTQAGGFLVPFGFKGRQTLIFVGEESGATVAVKMTVLPYTPQAQTSTYGGLPGTTVSFYASGFARDEVVHVYIGHDQNNASNMVSCFRTDDRGNVGAAGSYVIPGTAQGQLVFQLIGSKSGGVATAKMAVEAAPAPVQVPAQPPFTCPLDTTN
jgi:hypothetical protein